MHEMGKIKRAQEHRVVEVSMQKLRENHETIQLTSQLQQMQEQMNSVNDSGDFQDAESNFCGRLSHVSSQLVMIPSSRSLLSRDKRLPLDTWNQSGLQDNVLGKQFCTFDSPRAHPQRIQSDDVQRNREAVPGAWRTKTIHTSEDRQNQGTIPMPTFATKPLTTSSTIPAKLSQNYMVGQQRQQISELQFDKFPNPQSFLVRKIRFKTQVTTCSDCPSDAMLWIKEVEMVDSLDELKSRDQFTGFSEFRDAGREDCLCSEQDHPEFPVQEEGQPRGAESPKRGPVSTRKIDRLHDLRQLSSDWRSWHSIGLCWFILCYSYDDNIQEFDTKWDEVLLSMSKIPSDDILENLYKVRIRESARNSTPFWNCTAWRFIRRYRFPTIKSWKQWWSGEKLRNFDYETLTPGTGELNQEPWLRIEKDSSALKEEKVSITSRKKKASVRKETDAVSGRRPKIVRKNQNTVPARLLSQPYHEVEVCRGREVSEAEVTMGPFFDNRADIIWEVLARERLVNIGIRPGANSIKMKRVVRLETSVGFRITRLKNNQIKSPKRATSQKEETAMTRMLWFTESYATSSEYPWKERTIVGKINVKVPHQRSPYAVKFEDRSH